MELSHVCHISTIIYCTHVVACLPNQRALCHQRFDLGVASPRGFDLGNGSFREPWAESDIHSNMYSGPQIDSGTVSIVSGDCRFYLFGGRYIPEKGFLQLGFLIAAMDRRLPLRTSMSMESHPFGDVLRYSDISFNLFHTTK